MVPTVMLTLAKDILLKVIPLHFQLMAIMVTVLAFTSIQ